LALRHTAEKYERMIQSSPDAITLRSLPDRRYLEVNQGFTRLTGYAPEEVIGKTSAELNLWVEQAPHAATLKSLETEGRVHEEEFKFRTKSGEIRYGQLSAVRLMLDGQPVMLSITHDITNLKRAEEALRRSEADFRSLVEGAPYGIYRVTLDGELIQMNPAFVKMVGFESEAELLRTNINQIYRDPDARKRLIDEYWEKKDFREVETQWKRKDGRSIEVRLTGRPVSLDGAGSGLTYFEVFVEDVTERRSLERQFLQSQKMDAIGRLAGGIAHDFNNLLGIILGHSEMLGHAGSEPRLQKNMAAIQKAAERAAALTMQLLTFSRKQVMEPKVIDVAGALNEIKQLMGRVLGEDIELTLKVQPQVGHIRIDPVQFDQVLMNLIVNSRDAMPRGGKLAVEAANVEFDHAYVRQHLGTSTGSYVMVAVSDTGVGMDGATLSQIFEPFFTTKEEGKGTGLGLSTVYGIVRQAGGHALAYSEPGRGTTMRVYFPRVEQGVTVGTSSAPMKEIPRGTETILLVEDEAALRELARAILQESGYTVFDAGGVEQAMQIAREAGIRVDLVLTDVVMPRIGGRELAERLKALRPDLKILFMSGYAGDIISQHGVGEKGDGVLLQKPFSRRTLLTKIREVLDDR
jgi:PAS domain S-box-containing protein